MPVPLPTFPIAHNGAVLPSPAKVLKPVIAPSSKSNENSEANSPGCSGCSGVSCSSDSVVAQVSSDNSDPKSPAKASDSWNTFHPSNELSLKS